LYCKSGVCVTETNEFDKSLPSPEAVLGIKSGAPSDKKASTTKLTPGLVDGTTNPLASTAKPYIGDVFGKLLIFNFGTYTESSTVTLTLDPPKATLRLALTLELVAITKESSPVTILLDPPKIPDLCPVIVLLNPPPIDAPTTVVPVIL